jgi:signal transduction histidine kinase
MALAVALLVVIFLAVNWYYYRLTSSILDQDFTLRLETLAALVSLDLGAMDWEPNVLHSFISDTLLARLRELSIEHSLSNILVVREDGITLLALQPDLFPPGELYLHWSMDYRAIIEALEGTPSATDLYRAPDGTYMKAGYAPLPLYAPAAGSVAAVEASAGFLAGLEDLRTVLIAATAVSIVGIALFTWFVLKATGSLIRARESLMESESLASMGRMAAGIAHEIRNPLFIIRSSAEKLKEASPERAGEIDGFILEEVDRLNTILTDYLLFARDEEARRDAIDLVSTLRRSVRLMRESIESGGIGLAEQYDVTEAPFHGEDKKLQQAFLNILLNAEQSTSEGGTITVALTRRDDRYRITFADTGSGVPPKELDKIFEPFYTTKPTGSGLGLAIVKRVVEDHGGDVAVTSALDSGTSVTVTFPVQQKTGEGNEQDSRS